MRLRFTIVYFLIAILLAIILLAACIQPTAQSTLPGGDVVYLKGASLFQSVGGSSYRIIIQDVSKGTGQIELWQDLFHGPIVVVQAPELNGFLCLYEFDTDLRLIRIDPNLPFIPFTKSSCLPAIVCSSTWRIDEAKIKDWQHILNCLRGGQPTFHIIGLRKSRASSKAIAKRVNDQVRFMLQNGATQWPVTTTLRYPLKVD